MKKRDSDITGIILAAGKSSRMGKIKQLLPFRGNSILGHVINNCLKSSLRQIIVVLGYRARQIQQAVNFHGVKVVVNKDCCQGLSSSLRVGLSYISDSCDGVLFVLGDQPLVDESVIDALIKGFYESHAPIIVPYYRGRRGNPVFIGRSLFHQLEMNLKADMGARPLLKKFNKQIKEINIMKASVNFDVDTIDDYNKLLSFENAGSSDNLLV